MSRIIELTSENIKCLRAVTIRPKGHLVVIGGDNGQGKCLPEGTKICLWDGRRKEIQDIRETDMLVGLNPVTWEFVPESPLALATSGVQEVFELRTRHGYTIQATDGHRLLAPTGWKEIGRLEIGGHVAIPVRLPAAQSGNGLSHHEAMLLGLTLGDGTITRGLDSCSKLIPEAVFGSGMDVIATFLAGLFSTDGWVCGAGYSEYYSRSPHLISAARALLLRCGIPTSFTTRSIPRNRNTAPGPFYRLSVISGASRTRFLDMIVPRICRAQMAPPSGRGRVSACFSLPHEAVALLRKHGGKRLSAWIRGHNRMSRDRFLRAVSESGISVPEVRRFASRDIGWDTIVSIKSLGRKQTFDLQMPSEAFVANDFVVHNSSILDSIAYAIGGRDGIAEEPIRRGQDSASIVLKMDDMVIRRTFNASGRTVLSVEDLKGKKHTSPQSILDRLTSKLTFDPLGFMHMDDKPQAAALRAAVGIDFADIDAERQKLFDERTEVNRELDRVAAVAGSLPHHADAPVAEQSASDVISEIEQAQAVNARIAGMATRRQEVEIGMKQADAEARRIEAENNTLVKDTLGKAVAKGNLAPRIAGLKAHVAALDVEIAEMERHLAAKRADRAADARDISTNETALLRIEVELAANDRQRASNLATREVQIQRGGVLAHEMAALQQDAAHLKPVAVEPLKEKLDRLEGANRKARDNAARVAADKAVEAQRAASAALTVRLDAIDAEKARLLAAAPFPVSGLSFNAVGGVTLDGLPFSQASTSAQLRVSVAIAAAMNPKLRVMLVRDGSFLDAKSLSLLGDLAAQHDLQVWVERVAKDEACSVIIEDGNAIAVPDTL